MIAARRVYFYLVAFVSLHVAAWGAAELGRAVVDALYPSGGTIATGLRQDVARDGALLVVGLPLWLLHWGLANRASRRDETERGATLRRLYVYAVLATMVIAFAAAAQNALEAALGALLDERPTSAPSVGRQIAAQVPWLAVAGVLWVYHQRVVVADRLAVGEVGGSATLRRWYVYGVSFVALLYLLSNAAKIARLTWETVARAATGGLVSGGPVGVAGAAATALVAVGVWLAHWSLRAVGPEREEIAVQDVRSALRPVYLFGGLAGAVAFTLAGLSQLLYYALGRALGVERPGGVGGNLLVAAAGPATTALVYGAAWLYQRRAVRRQSEAQAELPGQVGVRRLYVYLVSLLAIGVVATGAGGLLWTIADLATAAPRTVSSRDWWREQVSLYATLLAVGVPVWALNWGPVAARTEEVGSLARRIYLYVTLGAAVLALLGAGVAAVREILLLALGETATASAITDLARALSVAAVSGVVIAYHQRVLRRDLGVAHALVAAPEPAVAVAETAPPFEGRPYAVVYATAGGEQRVEWWATREEARAAEERLRDGAAWAVTVRVDGTDPSLRSG